MLTVLDEHTKEMHVLQPERRIGSADVISLLEAAIAEHGAPEFIHSDNWPEFIAKELQLWLAEHKIKIIYIIPASPRKNGFVESFHSRFRDECLNREQLWTFTEARVVIEDFRHDYNTERPHSSLAYDSPRRFAARHTLAILGSGPDHHAGPSLHLGLPTTTSEFARHIHEDTVLIHCEIGSIRNSMGESLKTVHRKHRISLLVPVTKFFAGG